MRVCWTCTSGQRTVNRPQPVHHASMPATGRMIFTFAVTNEKSPVSLPGRKPGIKSTMNTIVADPTPVASSLPKNSDKSDYFANHTLPEIGPMTIPNHPPIKGKATNTQRRTKADIENGTEKPTPLVVIAENIPGELKAVRQWVAWLYTWKPPKGDKPGKWTKPPINANAGGNASSTNPETWCLFRLFVKSSG